MEKPKDSLTKEETLSMISHELKTSLTASKWIIEMLQDGDVGELSTTQKEMMTKLSISNQRMMNIVSNLIMLSRTGTHENEYNISDVNIVNVIDSIVFEFGGEAFSQHIELVYIKPEEDFPNIKGDESKLRIVFQNLIDNAIKYSKDGDRVVISLTKETEAIKITVKDTGIGIAEKDLPLIASQFYRAPNAVEKSGSGIGLYICSRIIEGHKGKINIQSSLGQGTTMTVTLPIGTN